MKITYISNSIIPSRTANSIHVMKVCQAFSQLGHKVILIAPDRIDSYEVGINDIYSYYGVENIFSIRKLPWFKRLKGKSYIYGLFAAFKSFLSKTDIVYCRHLYGAFFATFFQRNVIFESHAPVSGKADMWMFQHLIKMKKFSKLVVITHTLKDYYLTQYPELHGRIIVAPDGADLVDRENAKVSLGYNNSKLQVGYVGHLYPGRGMEVIVKLAKSCKWAEFHIIGGTNEDIEYWKESAKANNVRFHGFVSPKEAEAMRLACDVLLSPYQNSVAVSGGTGNTVEWMSPLKIFEYMAAGKVIISSDLPVLHEVLEHEKNAILCNPENVEEWVSALEKVRDNPILAKKIADEALENFVKNYTWYARMENIIGSLK